VERAKIYKLEERVKEAEHSNPEQPKQPQRPNTQAQTARELRKELYRRINRKTGKNVTDARCASGRLRAPIRFGHFSELKTPEKRPRKLADKQTPTAPHCNASADAAPTSAFRFGPKTPLAN
jgi:hypothetical protein